MAGKCEAGRDGSWVAQNEPSALETLTTTGFSDLRSSGSAASVTRMMPTAFVSNTSRALGAVERLATPPARLAMPALLTRTSSPPSGLDLGEGGGDGGVVGDVELDEPRAELLGGGTAARLSRAPT